MELHRNNRELAGCLERVRGIADRLPMCSHCHSVRAESGDGDGWLRIESYLRALNGTQVSHGICPACLVAHYPNDIAQLVLSARHPERDGAVARVSGSG